MPTGYTADIKEGISFNDFAMQCARAMGACVSMRDDPHSAAIPLEFKPSTYHFKALKEARKNLKTLQSLSPKQIRDNAKKEFKESVKQHEASINSKNELRLKYKNMLQKVQAWQPPTPEHISFKTFMIEQLAGSIDFDCDNSYSLNNHPKYLSVKEWLSKEIAKAFHDIDYHTKENQEEFERADSRTAWIQQLRNSLNIK